MKLINNLATKKKQKSVTLNINVHILLVLHDYVYIAQ